MSDRTFLITFFIINALMWYCAADWMRRCSRQNQEIFRKYVDYEHKNAEYFHNTFELLRQMTTMNVSAMNEFLEQLSVNIKDKGKEKNEAENRE